MARSGPFLAALFSQLLVFMQLGVLSVWVWFLLLLLLWGIVLFLFFLPCYLLLVTFWQSDISIVTTSGKRSIFNRLLCCRSTTGLPTSRLRLSHTAFSITGSVFGDVSRHRFYEFGILHEQMCSVNTLFQIFSHRCKTCSHKKIVQSLDWYRFVQSLKDLESLWK